MSVGVPMKAKAITVVSSPHDESRYWARDRYWVRFDKFLSDHDRDVIYEWFENAGIEIEPETVMIDWSIVLFKNEEDAMLCLLAFR